ncbi:TIGR02680 family protein [Nocardia salmonicida]|uniref:TIGR02680 family protein n=1 Tax=Nocardia salmonicida TaxID=53431 RepID=UPI0036732A7D
MNLSTNESGPDHVEHPGAAALHRILSGQPPIPVQSRYQPLRMGMIGIWEYEEQEFVFYDGKLILRGRNGSGKTKALEVTSPLLFDAVLNARRIDPFGNASRSMRDNLLFGGRDQQVGYVWTEYGRVADDGSHEFFTIGIGMHAMASRPKLVKWFFATHRRIGIDFALWDSVKRPHVQKQLEPILGEQCVFDRAKDYRAAVATQLFGFSPARLKALVELLLTLRKPKLSEDFNAEKLAALLSQSLPPVSTTLVDDLARKFDELADNRDELATLVRNQDYVEVFLSAYRRFARRVVNADSGRLLDAGRRLKSARDFRGQKMVARGNAIDEVTRLRIRGRQLILDQEILSTRIADLRASPEMQAHEAIIRLQDQVEDAAKGLSGAIDRLVEAQGTAERSEAELSDAAEAREDKLSALDRLEAAAAYRATAAGLTDVILSERSRIRVNPDSARLTISGHIESQAALLKEANDLADKVEVRRGEHKAAETEHKRLIDIHARAHTECEARREEVQQLIGQLIEFLGEWASDCIELVLTSGELAELCALVRDSGELQSSTLADLLRPFARRAEQRLAQAEAADGATLNRLQLDHRAAKQERERVAKQTDPLPAAPITARRDRSAALADGAPLWKLLEFNPGLSHQDEANLESALLAAGILDAWVTAEGQVLQSETLETIVLSTRPRLTGLTLAHAVSAVDHPLIPQSTTQSILAAIELGTHAATESGHPRIGMDGSWQIGPLQGRTSGQAAAFIGATAREAERARRLAELDATISAFEAQITGIRSAIAEIRRRQDIVAEEYNRAHDKDANVRRAQQELATSTALHVARGHEVDAAAKSVQTCQRAIAHAQSTFLDYVQPRSLPTDVLTIVTQRDALAPLQSAIIDTCHAASRWLELCDTARKAERRHHENVTHRNARTDEFEKAKALLESRTAALETRRSLAGSGPQEKLAEIGRATTKLDEIKTALEQHTPNVEAAAQQVGAMNAAVLQAGKDCDSCEEQYRLGVDRYRDLANAGYLALAKVDSYLPTDMDGVEAKAREAIRLLAGEQSSERDRDAARDQVDAEFRTLEANLIGPDWRPRASNDGSLVLVQIWHNGKLRTVPEAQAVLADEISTRRTMLDDSEYKLFTEVLLGNLGDHLRRRRAEAANLIERMGELLQNVETASGYRMKLIWEPAARQSSQVKAALDALDGQASKHLSDTSREQLIQFLVGQIEEARASGTTADWRDHLHKALDYRTWSQIRIRYRPGPKSSWTDLTNDKHQSGSGGEKAVMLQLPLLVAAAAHYAGASQTAPRPIYLDEAFAGIDAEMRGRCMGLLTSLNLDVVMASHDEWGFHKEVPGVATYMLYRNAAIPGVLATPIIWDGSRRHDLPDAALRFSQGQDVGLDWGDEEDSDPYEDYEEINEAEWDDNEIAQGVELTKEDDSYGEDDD